ncbi:3-isopropylmalate dehydrogenase [Methylacidiphilum infernorum V4]|uniref:AMP nucleosidase n=1 Tax=Methylacidiphilum infernorum (isolate V4) TaxID=481448 RepID=B3DWL4_METI4|nr:3-isopropylmalate dehydrogenase [Methylacidiphilum infernorum V4]
MPKAPSPISKDSFNRSIKVAILFSQGIIDKVTEKKSFTYSTGKPEIDKKIEELLQTAGIEENHREYFEMIATVIRFASLNTPYADVRLINQSLKEIRYAQSIFQPYRSFKKVTIFGSARIRPQSPEWLIAKDFARLMVESGFMVITGGGEGIMEAAQFGAGKDKSFGLNIRLPFEQKPNEVIDGDPKLINFRYFFNRKLHFVKESHAIALFPGGFGTMDECFETLTLLQTGKANLVPFVFIDVAGGNYWRNFVEFLSDNLLKRGLISAEDFHLFLVTENLYEAKKEILSFYHNFHSYRFVGENLVIRIYRVPAEEEMKSLRDDFSDILIKPDSFYISSALPQESNEPEIAHLPRIVLSFNKRSYGRLRLLINRINLF